MSARLAKNASPAEVVILAHAKGRGGGASAFGLLRTIITSGFVALADQLSPTVGPDQVLDDFGPADA
jgi:hypothetical protein